MTIMTYTEWCEFIVAYERNKPTANGYTEYLLDAQEAKKLNKGK